MGTGKLSGKPDEMLVGNLAMDQYFLQGGRRNTPSRSMLHGNRDKLRLGGPLRKRLTDLPYPFKFTGVMRHYNWH